MTEMIYNLAELTKLKYAKITYTDLDNKNHEIRTDIKSLNDDSVALYFKHKTEFNINCPQEITIKFVTDSAIYIAKSTLNEIKKQESFVHFIIASPEKMTKRQDRKYYRVSMKRACVLVATDKAGSSTCYMSKMIDVSAGGILIHKLESMFKNDFVTLLPDDYKYFNIVLFLDIDTVLKLSARYVRQETNADSNKYAFEFVGITQRDIDTISKYVTKEQIVQLKKQNKF